jgi:hypothetical protein
VGFGVEWVIIGPWRAKVEYLFADLNGFSCDVACGGFRNPNVAGPISMNLTDNIIRAGVNYGIWDR